MSLVPLKLSDEFDSVSRVPLKYGMELVCHVEVPVPPLPAASVPVIVPSERQLPAIEKHPAETLMPFAKVEDALAEVMLSAVV